VNQTLIIHHISTHKKTFSIFLVWLFHLSAIIGITLGHTDWFVAKTPLNLLLAFALLALNYPLNSPKKWLLTAVFFVGGMLVEWIGAHYGFLFGEYYYGENLGPKLDGVPWLIGINWAMLILITGAIASKISGHFFWKIFWGATLMVVLDYFMEVSAPVFDFWIWETEGAPVRNYIAWFFIAGVLHFLYQRSKMQGDILFSFHLYAAQFVFFAYFYVVNGF
jgi:putative membrane protein